MQAYLKLKTNNQELYETNVDFSINKEEKFFEIVKKIFLKIFYLFVVKIKEIGNIITVKEIYSGFIFILPVKEKSKYKLKKYISKIQKLMKKYKITSLIISDELKQNEDFMKHILKDNIMQKEINILDGKKLMFYLVKEITEYILNKQNKKMELENLYILLKSDNVFYKENITYLSQYFKTINIITPCINSYQKFASQLERNQNVMITVTNNKKKSLRKADLIINFDVPIAEMKKYVIYRRATIVYLKTEENYNINGFDGINICQAGIDVSEEIKEFLKNQYLLNQCSLTVLYESLLDSNKGFLNRKEQIKKDKVIVTKLYGNNGVLEKNEYEKNVS